MDSASPDAAAGAFEAFLERWGTQIGDGFPMPAFRAATVADFRVKARAVRVGDTAITDMRCASALQTDGSLSGVEDQVRMYVVHRGAWTQPTRSAQR